MFKSVMLHIGASIVRYFPGFGRWMFVVYRRFAARFTIGAMVIITNDARQVLMVKHRFHPTYPWGLPGGVVEHNEEPQITVRREVKEELGLDVRITGLLQIDLSDVYRHHMQVLFRGELETPVDLTSLQLSIELEAVQWYAVAALPATMHPLQRACVEQYVENDTPSDA